MRKRRVAVVGATGVAGQQFLAALAGHPWFEVGVLAASARSAGQTYGEAIRDATGAGRWWGAGAEPSADFLALTVEDAARLDPGTVDLVFAAVESDAARACRRDRCRVRVDAALAEPPEDLPGLRRDL